MIAPEAAISPQQGRPAEQSLEDVAPEVPADFVSVVPLADGKLEGTQAAPQEVNSSIGELDEKAKPVRLKWYHYILLVSLNMLIPFSTDAYVPSMPDMQDEFHTDEVRMGLSVQINMVVGGISSVVGGYISDRIGRRPVLCVCILCLMLGASLCATSPTLEVLLMARSIQGFAAGAIMIPVAVVRDTVDDTQEFLRAASMMGAMRPAVIIAAPAIGGGVASVAGWRAVFWLTLGWAGLNLIATFVLLPETLFRAGSSAQGASTGGRGAKPSLEGAAGDEEAPAASQEMPRRRSTLSRLCCDRLVVGCLLTFALLFAGIVSVISDISFVLTGYFHLNEAIGGLLFGSIPCAMFVPPVLVGLLSFVGATPLLVLRVGMLVGLVVAGAACAVALLAPDSIWAFMAVLYGLVVTESMTTPALSSLLLLPLKDMSGLAASLQDGIRSFVCAGVAVAATEITGLYYAAGLLLCIAFLLASASATFWLSFGLRPPAVALQA